MSEGNIITELLDDCVIKDGQNLNEFRLKGEFRYNQNKLNKIMDDNDIIYIAKLPFRPNHVKKGGEIKKMENILSKKFMYGCDTNEDGSTQLNSIIENSGFDNPKPKGLIHLLLKATTYCKTNALVLDFFAGSGTTGHAVLALNEADKGSRRFILCQSNEVTETTPNGIAYDVTSKRLKRIMTGECYDGKKDFKWVESNLPYGDNLDVYEIGRVFHAETTEGKTPFDVIDETLYGREKFKTLREKVEWVCSNFENCQKCVQNDDEWESDKRVKDDATRS